MSTGSRRANPSFLALGIDRSVAVLFRGDRLDRPLGRLEFGIFKLRSLLLCLFCMVDVLEEGSEEVESERKRKHYRYRDKSFAFGLVPSGYFVFDSRILGD